MSDHAPHTTRRALRVLRERPRSTALAAASVGLAATAAMTFTPGALHTAATVADSADTVPDLGGQANPLDRPTANVTRGALEASKDFGATIDYGAPYSLTTGVAGVVTWSQPNGAPVNFGDQLIRVDDRPLYLVEGAMPMYRTLQRQTNELTGADVTQLQAFLLSQDFDDRGRLVADGSFNRSTERAVKTWQKHVGLPQTGRIDNSQIVFSAHPVRIDLSSRVGSTFESIEVTDRLPIITTDADLREISWFEEASDLQLNGPDGSTIGLVVADRTQVTSPDGQRSWMYTLELADMGDANRLTALSDGNVTASVTATDLRITDALLTPTSSLVALAEGGFAVEKVVAGSNTQLIRVELLDVLDSLAAVDGDIGEGDEVTIPS